MLIKVANVSSTKIKCDITRIFVKGYITVHSPSFESSPRAIRELHPCGGIVERFVNLGAGQSATRVLSSVSGPGSVLSAFDALQKDTRCGMLMWRQ